MIVPDRSCRLDSKSIALNAVSWTVVRAQGGFGTKERVDPRTLCHGPLCGPMEARPRGIIEARVVKVRSSKVIPRGSRSSGICETISRHCRDATQAIAGASEH